MIVGEKNIRQSQDTNKSSMLTENRDLYSVMTDTMVKQMGSFNSGEVAIGLYPAFTRKELEGTSSSKKTSKPPLSSARKKTQSFIA